MASSGNGPSLQSGAIIKAKWKVVKKIGQGAFGDSVAIKVESVDSEKQVLKLEVAVLKKLQTCSWVVPFVACGRHADFNFLVMELLGENIAELRRLQQGRFTMTTTLKLGIQMIKGIESVHDLGYLHRDIKPSNFAMGLTGNKRQTCFLIDFGLARRYMLPDGEIRPPRDCAGFRGTARYASIHSHQSRDLGRRDDLWSVLYLLIEFALGQLPWRRLRDKDKVGEMKVKCNNDDLVAGLPEEFLLFMRHLTSLQYQSRPDYAYLINMFENLYTKLGGADKTPFDWEMPLTHHVLRSRPMPSLLDFSFVKIMANFDTIIESADQSLLLKIPFKIKKRMIEFLLRLKEGKFPHTDKLLDNSMKEVNLVRSKMSVDELLSIARILTDLRSLKLGQCTDEVVKEFVEKNPDLEDIVIDSKQTTDKCLKSISNCRKLRSIEIIDSEKVGDKGIEGLLKTCENLSEVTLKNCKKFKGGGFKLFVGEKSALRTKKPLPCKLSKIDISSCPLDKGGLKKLVKISSNLEVLILRPLVLAGKSAANELPSLIKKCRTMKRLEISSELSYDQLGEVFADISQECKQLEVLHIGSRQLVEQHVVDILSHCKNLKEFSVSQETDSGFAATTLPRTLRNCSSMTRVHIKFGDPLYKPSSISDSGLKAFLHTCNKLTELSLVECLILGQGCWSDTCFFPYLKSLDLSDCVQLQDDMISRITESTPCLTTLKINRLNGINRVSLDSIASHCPLLEECEMKGCVCFLDDDLHAFMKRLPLMFLTVTRYTKRDTVGIEKEMHFSNAEEIFMHYPNAHRDFVYANLSYPLGS